ncbi:phage tail protein [Enterobacter hormaechei]|uniref:phage tail-collar fiber domain-containing protein n=1 Tax=Enterobacter hormaechei TaxID=158836 RepID=UPI002FF19F97|nr:phage tail protein [Enterobacter hormaechei subsp. xiangfangensis]HCM9236313.1 phage tail protein [Enterobacter hormaechei subsp. xiangfangensis]HCM9451946.1 phage tail protein [Enterobacter hormaechei subsp. xiangfangensis]HCM9466176.1 phage tail protein [Enterobacter hormaechei subsp. xiangfangensis]HCM9611104.1 phage tail protein [Enterobacter hormaechei subsp. xiangfangensis]
MTVKYKTVITKAGAVKLAAATVPNGKKVNFTAMAIGDGGGTLPVPDPNQTKLVKEVWRHALNKISQDNKNKNYVVAELLIPPETGGFWMREMGLYDDTGTLIAVGNMAESYKPALAEGSGRAQTVRMVIMVSDIESVELTIDTSMVMATQDYVDDKLAEHEQSRRHPDATLTAKGFTQLSSATDSASESVAATPKAVKAAYDLAKGKYTAQDATTAQKGIVQLSSAVDSSSESVAATPKAVKVANDNANSRLPLAGGWLTGGFGIKTSIGSVSFGVGNSDVYIANGASNKFLQLKHTGELKYDDKAIYHEGYKPTADDVGALPAKGTAEAAKKLATARKIAGVDFDGTKDISLKTTNLDDAGTAATKDVTTSNIDTTGGRVLRVGDFGVGAVAGVGLTDANNINFNGFFRMSAEGIHGPVANQASELIHCQYDQNTGRQIGWRAGRPDEPLRHRTKMNGEWQGWIKLYDSNNPPTADEVDAVSASKGGTYQKEVTFSEGVKIRNATGIYQGEDAVGFSSNNLLLKSWNGIGFYCTLTGSEGVTVFVDTRGGHVEARGQIKPGSYENFDNRFYTKTLANSTFQKVNTASKGSRGWFKDSNTGMIFQWGIESVSGATTRTFSFPVSFPTGCASLTVSNNIERTAGENSMTGFIKSASQYSLSNTAATDRQLCWFAIGY